LPRAAFIGKENDIVLTSVNVIEQPEDAGADTSESSSGLKFRFGPPLYLGDTIQAMTESLDLTSPLELIVISVKEKAVRCRMPGSGTAIVEA